jgi:hypothetical protein
MKITIYGKPTFRIAFNRTLVDALKIVAEHHYDGVCKSIGRQGGWLYGVDNSLAFTGAAEQTTALSWREADTALKVMEMRRYHTNLSAPAVLALEGFDRSLRKAMDTAQQVNWSIDVTLSS